MSKIIDRYSRDEVSRTIKGAARSDALYALLAPWQCGVFDGGCLMFADALQQVFAMGELHGLMGYWRLRPPQAARWQHAVVALGQGLYVDGDGISTRATLHKRWFDKELTVVVAIEPMAPRAQWATHYAPTPYDTSVVIRMKTLLATALSRVSVRNCDGIAVGT